MQKMVLLSFMELCAMAQGELGYIMFSVNSNFPSTYISLKRSTVESYLTKAFV